MNADELFSQMQEQLDGLIVMWRESLARKQERHGEHFDEHKAMPDLWARLKDMPPGPMAALLASALNRLAHMEDYNPIPIEIAGLDFETPNIEELMKDETGKEES